MAFILFIFFVAAAISSVAAYFSLVGLGSIFAATFWGVVIMAGTLEVGKIVATKWVHSNWRNPRAPWYFRGLICFFVACLMAITSLGIYGYLSRGHLDQQAPLAGLGIQVAQLETQLKQKQDENGRLENRLTQIGKITDKVLEGSGRAGLRASQQQKKESATIQSSIDENNKEINDITTKLVPLKMKTGNVQGELGVAKFIAEALGWEPEKAIRIIISLIMAAFDPLALSMFIMGSISLKELQERRRKVDEPQETIQPPVPNYTEQMVDAIKEDVNEQAEREAALDAAKAAIERERQEFEEAIQQANQAIDEQARDLVSAQEAHKADHAALQNAHQQLLEMESRINDERELLTEWEAQLSQQQSAINAWVPPSTDDRPAKDRIIEMLEKNPEVINEIVAIVDAMRPPQKPGL